MDSLRTTAVSVLTLASCALLSQPLASQATALLREGDVPAGAAAGQVVTALNNTAVNQVGGYAVSLSTSDGISTLSQALPACFGLWVGAFMRSKVIDSRCQV